MSGMRVLAVVQVVNTRGGLVTSCARAFRTRTMMGRSRYQETGGRSELMSDARKDFSLLDAQKFAVSSGDLWDREGEPKDRDYGALTEYSRRERREVRVVRGTSIVEHAASLNHKQQLYRSSLIAHCSSQLHCTASLHRQPWRGMACYASLNSP